MLPVRHFLQELQDLALVLLELVYPSVCPLCRCRLSVPTEMGLCLHCMVSFNWYVPHFYAAHERLYSCPLFNNLYALYTYAKGTDVQRAIHALKYQGYASVARILGQRAVYRFGWSTDQYDIIVAVPAEPRRLSIRGFNQTLVLASEIAHYLSIPATDNLIRRRSGSKTQTRLRRLERWENAKHAFYLSHQADELLRGRRILLVDDVLTTGSTLLEMCYLLESVGVKSIDVFVPTVAVSHI